MMRIPAAAFALVLLALVVWTGQSHAAGLPEGRKMVTLVAADGARQPIGVIDFVADANARRFDLKLDGAVLQEEFLSMRPFQCLPDTRQMWCHLAYPYGSHRRITPDDLVDLEYALMFLWRSPVKVGIDAWNGLYYKLALAADGAITGALHEADFNVLAVPPDASFARPVAHGDLTPASANVYRFPTLEIR